MLTLCQDTTGRSLEDLDSLFQRPWYSVYKVAYPSHNDDLETNKDWNEKVMMEKSEHVEKV